MNMDNICMIYVDVIDLGYIRDTHACILLLLRTMRNWRVTKWG